LLLYAASLYENPLRWRWINISRLKLIIMIVYIKLLLYTASLYEKLICLRSIVLQFTVLYVILKEISFSLLICWV
jgi:hypothetical protein